MSTSTNPPLPYLPRRSRDSHKGDYGRALLIGGSRGMTGAISLAGMAALRGGAGLVTLAVPDVCLDIVAGIEPSYMTVPLPSDPAGRIDLAARPMIAEAAAKADVLACGPGLGRSPGLVDLVAWLYQTISQPMVFDADALNALATRSEVLTQPGGPRILTPHAGEFARLLGQQSPLPKEEGTNGMSRADLVAKYALKWQAVIVLKGHRTLVGDGRALYENTTGNPGMATGGTGDVLTGLITALLAQKLAPFAAAQLSVHVHGRAGDLAAEKLGEVSLIARDLNEYLPLALREVEEGANEPF